MKTNWIDSFLDQAGKIQKLKTTNVNSITNRKQKKLRFQNVIENLKRNLKEKMNSKMEDFKCFILNSGFVVTEDQVDEIGTYGFFFDIPRPNTIIIFI